jgi:bis(5'-nucleosidyl)-tetraphosphatase
MRNSTAAPHEAPRTLSAGTVIVRGDEGKFRYLLLRAYQYWDFPKGLVEPGEDALTAARREVAEETGLTDLDFRWGPVFCETAPYQRNKVARYYLAESRQGEVFLPVSPELGHPEHDEFRWLDYATARSLLVPRVAAILDWADKIIKIEI